MNLRHDLAVVVVAALGAVAAVEAAKWAIHAWRAQGAAAQAGAG